RFLVQALQESRVNDDPAARLQNTVYFLGGGFWIGQMLENIEGKNTVECRLAKWKLMRVADDVGMPENLVLKFDAVRIALPGPARANVQDEIISSEQDLFVF